MVMRALTHDKTLGASGAASMGAGLILARRS